jgi:hypothetical protein
VKETICFQFTHPVNVTGEHTTWGLAQWLAEE